MRAKGMALLLVPAGSPIVHPGKSFSTSFSSSPLLDGTLLVIEDCTPRDSCSDVTLPQASTNPFCETWARRGYPVTSPPPLEPGGA